MLYAMFALVLLTYAMGIIALKARVNSVKSGTVKIKYYRTMQNTSQSDDNSSALPDSVVKSTRQFNNSWFRIISAIFKRRGQLV